MTNTTNNLATCEGNGLPCQPLAATAEGLRAPAAKVGGVAEGTLGGGGSAGSTKEPDVVAANSANLAPASGQVDTQAQTGAVLKAAAKPGRTFSVPPKKSCVPKMAATT